MGETSKIEWTDATINFWIGCTELTAACDHCYARELSKRYGWADWGAGMPRHQTKGAHATARALQRKAMREGRRLDGRTHDELPVPMTPAADHSRARAAGVEVREVGNG